MMGVVGGVVLVTCLLTVFFFPLDSLLLWGKVAVGLGMVLGGLALNWEGVRDAASKRSAAFVVSSVVMAAGLAVVLGAVNYFAHANKKELDWTQDKVFTLSDQTVKALGALQEDVQVTAFFRKGEVEADAVKDLLERYQAISKRVRLDLVNPDQSPQLVEKYKVTSTSPRVVVESRGQDARVKEVTEEEVTNAILQVSTRDKKKLYFTTGHGEPLLESADEKGIKATVDDLGAEGYQAGTLNLVETESVPADAALVVVLGQEKPFFAPEAKILKEYLDHGGRLMVLAEPGVTTGLEDLLVAYRLKLGDNTVLDASQFGRLFGQGPDAAIVFEYDAHKVTEGMEGTATLFKSARSVQAVDGNADVTAQALASSNARSWGETKVQDGNWQWDPGELKGPVPLAAVATRSTGEVEGKRADEARLLVVGDADIASNQFRVMASNRDFLLNSVAWLVEDESRISIRPKQRGASRILLTPGQETLIAFVALDGLPVTLLAFGLGIWLVRRKR
jgi:ABC-type uncharacterized transport system involved in gliding motility auxiliary subunit